MLQTRGISTEGEVHATGTPGRGVRRLRGNKRGELALGVELRDLVASAHVLFVYARES